jgi:saccharopine dehydrogenase (NADP+, L-glutamate forming)
MKKILLFGAGKSATVLIDYLLANAEKENWMVTVADADIKLAESKIGLNKFGKAVSFDINNESKRNKYISESDIVISLLPPTLHTIVARSCVENDKNLLNASYVDDEIKELKSEIENRKLLFLCEMGLDPGIDHMSAMKIIDKIYAGGGRITSFKSHCGGLVAPESDNNPWHYKISWNPRNILLAGKAGALYKRNGQMEKIPYEFLFANCPRVSVQGLDDLVYYPNRDSLSYIPTYGLAETETFIRTTLRHPDFCKGWNYIIKASLTDEEPFNAMIDPHSTNLREWLDKSIASKTKANNFEQFLELYVEENDRDLVNILFEFLGLCGEEKLPAHVKCSADIMQSVIEKKFALHTGDRDMIVMQHEIEYEVRNTRYEIRSSLIVKGHDSLRTAMAKTVGLPLGIAAKLILNGTIKIKGLHIPTKNEIYEPVLRELEEYGIKFHEEIIQEL